MKTIFVKTLRENSRRPNDLRRLRFRGITYGQNSLRELGTQVWNNLPEEFKSAPSLINFKNLIKAWSELKCSCKMYKIVGNINDSEE